MDAGVDLFTIQTILGHRDLAKDPPPDMVLLRIYGYSAAPAEMDAEIAAEYAALAMGAAAEKMQEVMGG